jgi:hypothetical protein
MPRQEKHLDSMLHEAKTGVRPEAISSLEHAIPVDSRAGGEPTILRNLCDSPSAFENLYPTSSSYKLVNF